MGAAKRKPRGRRQQAKTPLVYGVGNTGLSIARYLAERNIDATFVDSREQPPGVEALAALLPDARLVTGSTPVELLDHASELIVSPGIADTDALIEAARAANIEVVSDIQVFMREAQSPVVGITGSNGKSTVTSLLATMCEAAGRQVRAGGNLGVPALDLLGDGEPDLYVLELSSFQLQRTAELPLAVAVLLNVTEDHLDWHRSQDEYRAAKYRILREARAAVTNREDDQAAALFGTERPGLRFGADRPGENEYGLVDEDGATFLARGEQLLLATDDVAMVGRHNHLNALAALAAGQLVGLGMSPMLQVLNEFPGLPHRMQPAGRSGGVDYINDSKATNVDAAIAAIDSLDRPVVLLAGGQGKGGDFERLARRTCHGLRSAIFFGEDAGKLAAAYDDLVPFERVADLAAAVSRAAELAQPGDAVLLAPACASFDQFDNYQARGDAFCRLVAELPR